MDFEAIMGYKDVAEDPVAPCFRVGDKVYSFRAFGGFDQVFIASVAKKYRNIHFPKIKFVGEYKRWNVWTSPYYEPLKPEWSYLIKPWDEHIESYINRLPSLSLKRAVRILYDELNKPCWEGEFDLDRSNIRMNGNTPIFLDPVLISHARIS